MSGPGDTAPKRPDLGQSTQSFVEEDQDAAPIRVDVALRMPPESEEFGTLSWGDTQLKVHLGRLVELEYVIAHRGSGHSQRFGYELVYKLGESDGPFLPGLISADELVTHEYDENRSGLEGNRSGQSEERSGSGRPPVGVQSGGGRRAEGGMKQHQRSSTDELRPDHASKPHRGNGQSKHVVTLPSTVAAPAAAS